MPGVSETRQYDALLTTTLANYRNVLEDQIFDVYPFLSWALGKLGKEMRGGTIKKVEDGGESLVEQLMYETNSTVAAYAGYEQLDTTPQEGLTIARFSWRQYSVSIAISGLERRSNMGEAKLIDLLKAKTKQAEMSLRNTLSVDAWGSSTGKTLNGLGDMISATSTYGGLNPTTYAWWASTVTASGSFAAQGLKDMRTLFNNLSWGNDTVDAIFMPQAVFEYFETSLGSQERYVNTKAANVGFMNLTFKSIPVYFDRDATAATIHMLNSAYLNWRVHRDADFETTPFIRPENQDATVAQILLQANFTTGNRRRHGKLTGVTA